MSRSPEPSEPDIAGLASADEYIPFHRPFLGEEEEQAVVEVLRSGWLTRGPRTACFEERFADHVGAKHAVALNSCTAALHLSLLTAGIGPGDEVITTPYTFAATANAIIHTGATPVFADIDGSSLNIDPEKAAAAVTTRTKAVIPVHFGGAPCDMNSILEIAERHGLYVIDDAAHALGAEYSGLKVGSISDMTAFSFYATKSITTGEGGMLTTDHDGLAERARVLSLHGMSADAWKRYSDEGHAYYEVVEPGFKYNMSDLQAALGIVQLGRDRKMHERRAEIACIYDREFSKMPQVRLLKKDRRSVHANHLYVLLLNLESLRLSRDDLARAMENLNVGVSVHFRSLHLHPFYRELYAIKPEDFPQALKASESALSLPLYPSMSDSDAVTSASVLGSLIRRFSCK